MKVLHISTFDTGGAGRAAIRLHKALLNSGIDSKFLCLFKDSNVENVFLYDGKPSLPEQILLKCGLTKTRGIKNKIRLSKIPGNYETFTFPENDADISTHRFVKEADIINLHWVSWFLDYSFFKKVNKPIVWTLHDMNPFLGGFHYFEDKKNNPWKIEETLLEKKRGKIALHKNISIVTLNNWMKDSSLKSAVFKDRYHTIIYNCIEENIFKPHDRLESRAILGLPQDKFIFSFICESLDKKRKGFDLLMESVSEFNTEEVLFCAIGETKFETTTGIRFLGKVSDDEKLALIYSAADAFIIPSREDNLPNVLLESLACGTPVIATPVGGNLDIIENGETGYLTDDVSSASITKALKKFMSNKDIFNREKIREFALENFSQKSQSSRYFELYNKLVSGL